MILPNEISDLIYPDIGECRQPQHLVQLASRFASPFAGAFVPTSGLTLTSGYGSGKKIAKIRSNPSYTGSSIVDFGHSRTLRNYADFGPPDDDAYSWPVEIPTARGNSGYTTIVMFYGIGNGWSQTVCSSQSHQISINGSGDLTLGYVGGNGFTRVAQNVSLGYPATDRWITAVVSSKAGSEVSIAANGVPFACNVGQISYVGDGNYAMFLTPELSTGSGYNDYYNLNGYVALWANLPGVFLTQAEAVEITKNPWQIFKAPNLGYFIPTVTGSGTTGTIVWTETNDVFALSGTVIGSSTGTISYTETSDIYSLSGSITSSGSVSWTETNDNYSILASVIGSTTGSIAWAESSDVFNITSNYNVSGNITWIESNDSYSITGGVIAGSGGSVIWTEQNDTYNISGSIIYNGTASWIEQDDSYALTGSSNPLVAGIISWTDSNDIYQIVGSSIPPIGIMTLTQADLDAIVQNIKDATIQSSGGVSYVPPIRWL